MSVLLKFGEEGLLEDFVQVEVDTLLGYSLHQVGSNSLIETVNAFLTPGRSGQIPESLVLLSARAADELALLNPGPHGGDRVRKKNWKNFTEAATDEVLLRDGWFRDLQLLIEDLWALINIHLDDSREGKYKAKLKSPQKTLGATFSINLFDLFLEVLKLADIFIHIQEHSGL